MMTTINDDNFSFLALEFIMDCNFDQGACEWVQDKTDDMDWSVAYHGRGNDKCSQIMVEDYFYSSYQVYLMGGSFAITLKNIIGSVYYT